MTFLQIISAGLIGFLAAWAIFPIIRSWAPKLASLRGSHFHQTHQTEVPRIGGLALAVAFALLSLCGFAWFSDARVAMFPVLVLGALVMFLLGFWDDLYPLGARVKLTLQTLIAGNVFAWGVQIDNFANPFTQEVYSLGIWSGPVTVFWLVAMTNLINLVDGLDGLAGGIAFMLMCLLAYVGLQTGASFPTFLCLGMGGALLAFLYHNFPPAKIYMGDGGAYFLGFLIGGMSILNSNKGTIMAALIAPLFALALPILDVSLSIFRRGLKGLPVFRPDKGHIHHRLVDLGLSHKRVVLSMYMLSLVFLLMAFGVFWSRGQLVPILFGAMFLVLIWAAKSSGFVKDWLTLRSLLGESWEMRKQVRYALSLCRWLELECERTPNVEDLWQDFQFLVRKLGFVHLEITSGESCRTWSSPDFTSDRNDLHRATHQVQGTTVFQIELAAPRGCFTAKTFNQLSELVAESWHRVLSVERKNGQSSGVKRVTV